MDFAKLLSLVHVGTLNWLSFGIQRLRSRIHGIGVQSSTWPCRQVKLSSSNCTVFAFRYNVHYPRSIVVEQPWSYIFFYSSHYTFLSQSFCIKALWCTMALCWFALGNCSLTHSYLFTCTPDYLSICGMLSLIIAAIWFCLFCFNSKHGILITKILTCTVWVQNPPPPEDLWQLFQNGWEFFKPNFICHYAFLPTLDYEFLFNYLQLWRSYAILSMTTQFTSCVQNVHHRPKRSLAFSDIFPKQLGIFRRNFTHLLIVHM